MGETPDGREGRHRVVVFYPVPAGHLPAHGGAFLGRWCQHFYSEEFRAVVWQESGNH